jgi:hypothetical protein
MGKTIDFIEEDLGNGKALHKTLLNYARRLDVSDSESLVGDFYLHVVESDILSHYSLDDDSQTTDAGKRERTILQGSFRRFVADYYRSTHGRSGNRPREVRLADMEVEQTRGVEDEYFVDLPREEDKGISVSEWQSELEYGLNEEQYALAVDFVETTGALVLPDARTYAIAKKIKNIVRENGRSLFSGLSDEGLRGYYEKHHGRDDITRTELSGENRDLYKELCGRSGLFDELLPSKEKNGQNERNGNGVDYSGHLDEELVTYVKLVYDTSTLTRTFLKGKNYPLFREMKNRSLLSEVVNTEGNTRNGGKKRAG